MGSIGSISKAQVLELLRHGTPQQRLALLQSLPPSNFRGVAQSFVTSDQPGMVLVGFGPIIQEFCAGRQPQWGAVLAEAAHERALEIQRTVPNHGLLPTTVSLLALSHVKALNALGRSQEVLNVIEDYLRLYAGDQNFTSLKLAHIEALINLRQMDRADAELQNPQLFADRVNGMEATRLKAKLDRLRADPTEIQYEQDPNLKDPDYKDLLSLMNELSGGDPAIANIVQSIDSTRHLDPNTPADYGQLLESLNTMEGFLTRGGGDSAVTVAGRIRNAASIFVHATPAPEEIENSLASLNASLAWARSNSMPELENDALWGIYLCHSRLHQPSEAADTLLALRRSLETMRRGIRDPLKRGGLFSTYPYLFKALCSNLQQSNRPADLLEAIESSKGRVIADRLTEQTGDSVEDSAIYSSVAALPRLVRSEDFHYLTFFVDDDSLYAIFVDRQGAIHAVDPIPLTSRELEDAETSVNPKQWGRPKPWAPRQKYEPVSSRLAPVTAWLESMLDAGIVRRDDHICYSPDDVLHNVPLQYLQFKDGILIDYFSLSRVHSVFHLDLVLRQPSSPAPERFLGFVVPTRQDLAKEGFLANLDVPLLWLREHRPNGEILRLEDATLERLRHASLDHAIVHFSTHGWFPRKGNPFRESYLLLADAGGLPDKEQAARESTAGKLTPAEILNGGLGFQSSHVSMMACVSGLAREGIAGDSLGLDWALIQAGASSLVSTHWEVSAASTARFFTLFYQKWIKQSQSRASAFRNTMRELLAGDRSPASLMEWTAFSLTGDFR